MNLILVRHGETEWNKERRFQGQHDVPLNDTGLWQAEQAARALAGEPIDLVASSDLGRALVTAEQIAAVCGAPLLVDRRWRELHFGAWEGLSFAEVRARDAEEYARRRADPFTHTPPGGESAAAARQRLRDAWKALQSTGAETAVVVAHGGTLSFFLKDLLGLSTEAYWQLKLGNASLSRLRIDAAGATALLLNDMRHLENNGDAGRLEAPSP